MSELRRELAISIEIIQRAGCILMENYAHPSGIETKADGTLVTDVDKSASRLITSELGKMFPDYGILDEESIDLRFNREYCWVVDPLDGTQEYVAKTGEFGIIIGLMRNFQPVLGVTYKPLANELIYAIKGSGAYRYKAEKITVTTEERIHLLVSRSRSSPELEQMVSSIGPAEITKTGGSLKIVEVAKGSANVFVCPSCSVMHLWDLCGTSVILEEASGKITDVYGRPFDYSATDSANRKGVVATNGLLHQRILDAMRR